jgi:hypothetical protein
MRKRHRTIRTGERGNGSMRENRWVIRNIYRKGMERRRGKRKKNKTAENKQKKKKGRRLGGGNKERGKKPEVCEL